MAIIQIRLASARPKYSYGEPLRLSYSVTNQSGGTLYVVTDAKHWLSKRMETAGRLVLLLGQVEELAKFGYYGYQPPAITVVKARRSAKGRLVVAMPPEEAFIGADGLVHVREQAPSGKVKVVLTIGYTRERFRPKGSDPLGEFLRAQRIAKSNAVTIEVKGP